MKAPLPTSGFQYWNRGDILKQILKITFIIMGAAVILLSSYLLYNAISEKSLGKNTRVVIVFKTMDKSVQFWQVVRAGIEAASREFDVKTEITGPQDESDVDDQIRILEQIIDTKPSAIVMAAIDYNKLVPVAEKIKKNGIKLITIDSAINSDISPSFIATDNNEAGRKSGQELSNLIARNTKVIIISHVKGTTTAIEREAGVRAGLSANLPKELIGETYFCNGSPQKAYEIVTEMLTKEKDIGGVIGLNEPSTLGAARAIKEMGLAGKVKLVGFDSSIEEIKLIEEGTMQATAVQKPFNMGYLGVETAVKLLKGEKVQSHINTGSELITKDNMFTPENQKLLFPFVDESYSK